MKSGYTEDELCEFNKLRAQGCTICVFPPSELGSMSADDAEEIMCMSVNDRVETTDELPDL
jgi:hypothetical protein